MRAGTTTLVIVPIHPQATMREYYTGKSRAQPVRPTQASQPGIILSFWQAQTIHTQTIPVVFPMEEDNV